MRAHSISPSLSLSLSPSLTVALGNSSAPRQSIKHAFACCALISATLSTSTRILLHIERDEALADSSWIRRRCTWLCHWCSCARDSLSCRQGQPGGL